MTVGSRALFERVQSFPHREQLAFGTAGTQRMLCFVEEMSRRTGQDMAAPFQATLDQSWAALEKGEEPDAAVWRTHMRTVGRLEVPLFKGENRNNGRKALEACVRLCELWLAPSVGAMARVFFTSVESFESAFATREQLHRGEGENLPGSVAEAERRAADIALLEAEGATAEIVRRMHRRSRDERQLFEEGMYL